VLLAVFIWYYQLHSIENMPVFKIKNFDKHFESKKGKEA